MQDVLRINAQEIEDNKIIRDIIDSVFYSTHRWNQVIMWLYIIFDCLPLFLQIFYTQSTVGVIACCLSVFFFQCALFCLEYVELKMNTEGFWSYISDSSNQVDVSVFVLTTIYSCFRIAYP